MKLLLASAAPIALFGLLASGQSESKAPAPLPVDAQWSTSRLWDDGLAEVARYDATRTIYGKERRFELVSVVVKEELDRKLLVKSDRPGAAENLEALKLNLTQRIETENYPYHFLTSVFVERADVRRFVKETNGSQEWCGNTFLEVLAAPSGVLLRWHSYWDGEGDGERTMERPANALLEDGLWLALRAAKLEAGKEHAVQLLPSRIQTRLGETSWVPATVVLAGREDVEVPAGKFTANRYEVRFSGGRVDRYWVDHEMPHAMLKVEQPALQGRSAALRELKRWAYWQR
ncbi:MAG: hypothetical protein JNJ88_03040 [Planctomycetes bacterium]|nr:hypothetical protein [Planctomycetota bacterium]